MDDLVIDACSWHVDRESRKYKQRALDHFRECYTVLLDWMRGEKLLRNPSSGQDVSDWMQFEFRKSDLTEDGWELVRRCHGNWNPAYGHGNTRRHLIR